jgi:hypothetical protein
MEGGVPRAEQGQRKEALNHSTRFVVPVFTALLSCKVQTAAAANVFRVKFSAPKSDLLLQFCDAPQHVDSDQWAA